MSWYLRHPDRSNPVAASLDSTHFIEKRFDGKFVASLDSGARYIRSSDGAIMLFDTCAAAQASVEAALALPPQTVEEK